MSARGQAMEPDGPRFRFEGVFTDYRTGRRYFYDVPYRQTDDGMLTPLLDEAVIPSILLKNAQSLRARVRFEAAAPSANTTSDSRCASERSLQSA